jgi:hypothetical protein
MHIYSSLKKFPESDYFLNNNVAQNISMSGIGTIHEVTSEQILLSYELSLISSRLKM